MQILKNFPCFLQTKPMKNTDGLHERGRKVYLKIAFTLFPKPLRDIVFFSRILKKD